MSLREAKKDLKAEYKDVEGIFGFGIGDGHLWVYVLPSFDVSKLPEDYGGYTVVPIVEGTPVALTSSP